MTELETALQKCQDTYFGVGPCYGYDYLLARHEYSKLLAQNGIIEHSMIEPKPELTTGSIRLSLSPTGAALL